MLLLLAGIPLDNVGAGDGADEVLAAAAVLVPVVRLVGADQVRNVWKCVFGLLENNFNSDGYLYNNHA